MCLYMPKKRDINEDIIAYKVLKIGKNHKKTSPIYKTFIWKINKEYAINTNEPDITLYDEYLEINGNAFHTFKFLDDAKTALISYKNRHNIFDKLQDMAIYECIIPQNTNFLYEGITGNNFQGYASEKLIIKKKIKTTCI